MSPDHLTSPQSIGQLLGCSLDGLELKFCIYSFFFSVEKTWVLRLRFSPFFSARTRVWGTPPNSSCSPPHAAVACELRCPARPWTIQGWGRLGGGGRLGLGAAGAGRYWPSPPLVSGRLRQGQLRRRRIGRRGGRLQRQVGCRAPSEAGTHFGQTRCEVELVTICSLVDDDI